MKHAAGDCASLAPGLALAFVFLRYAHLHAPPPAVHVERSCSAPGCGEGHRANLFKLCLDRGEVISAIRLEPGGIDEDDDRFVIEFSKDPSASALSIGPTERGAIPSIEEP
jgi:hypothetical protein